jgi:tetratricopeptide (TPR) repeat protein
MPLQPVCFYLPQFHAIPENDRWWGEGFTEWTLVRAAQSYFDGHAQPNAPAADLGYYNLLDVATRRRQAELARAHGIYGFCYYHYWFKGKRLLQKPLELMLEDGQPDLPFCLCWANEPWTRRWDGLDSDVLQPQDYGDEADWDAHFQALLPYLQHPRYIRVDDKPMLLLYRAGHIPVLEPMLARWRQRAAEAGLPGLWIVTMLNTFIESQRLFDGADATCEFHPGYIANMGVRMRRHGDVTVIDTEEVWQSILSLRKVHPRQYRGAFASWDNTPRNQQRGLVYPPLSPDRFEQLLRAQAERVMRDDDVADKFLFINAWNEWSETAYLEPDARRGTALLQAVKRVVEASPALTAGGPAVTGEEPRVLAVGRDIDPLHPHYVERAEGVERLVLARATGDVIPLLRRRRLAGRANVLEDNEYWKSPSLADLRRYVEKLCDGTVAPPDGPPMPTEAAVRILAQLAATQASPGVIEQIAATLGKQAHVNLGGLQLLGIKFNDLGKHQQASAVLAQARRLEPQNPRTLVEMARSAMLAGDLAQARSLLEHAIDNAPPYRPAWMLLARVFTQSGASDGRRWTERLRQACPSSPELAKIFSNF